MPNPANSPVLKFDTELSKEANSFTGSPVLVGTLTSNPNVILFKNQTTQTVFLSDENSTTKGTTMASGEEIIIDCNANRGLAYMKSWPIGTEFYVTAAAGAGGQFFKISIISGQ